MASVTLRGGKGDFVKRKTPEGKIEEVCLCKWNADFSARGCIAQVPGGLVEEVIDNGGVYREENRERYRNEYGGRLPDGKCDYCYARRHNYGRVTPAEVNAKTRKQFEEYQPKIVRLGKLTEAGHSYYVPTLIGFLNLCKEFRTSVIFPTKMLEFNERVARLLIDTNSVLNYSIGNDSLERGVCSQGCTNRWRIKQAHSYKDFGVNTTLTIACDVTSSIGDNVLRGFAGGDALNLKDNSWSSSLPLRLLPMRINRRDLAEKIAGASWEKLLYREGTGDKLPLGLVEVADPGRYIQKGNNELIPRVCHSDFNAFIRMGSICGRIGDIEFCDRCRVVPGVINFPASELIEVEYDAQKAWDRRKYWGKKRADKRQDVLF